MSSFSPAVRLLRGRIIDRALEDAAKIAAAKGKAELEKAETLHKPRERAIARARGVLALEIAREIRALKGEEG